MFNLSKAVEMLVQIRLAEAGMKGVPAHNQGVWGKVEVSNASQYVKSDDGYNRFDLLYDDLGFPVGLGSCDSGMCAAGHLVTAEGEPMHYQHFGEGDNGLPVFIAHDMAPVNGVVKRVSVRACEILGIEIPNDPDPDDEHWDDSNGMPMMFHQDANYELIADEVCYYANINSEQLESLVEAALIQEAQRRIDKAKAPAR